MMIGGIFPPPNKASSHVRKIMTLNFSFNDANNKDFVVMKKGADFILLMGQIEAPYVPTSKIPLEEDFGPPLSDPCLCLCFDEETLDVPPLVKGGKFSCSSNNREM